MGDDGAAYSVEVRLDDGQQVEVNLDSDFNVIGSEPDDDGAGDEDPALRGEGDGADVGGPAVEDEYGVGHGMGGGRVVGASRRSIYLGARAARRLGRHGIAALALGAPTRAA